MAHLDEFLGALHQGVWEVVVPRSAVTEPLGPEWQRSAINVPSPGTIASFRKGQYHVHETEQDYRVHMDRYDPEKNPFMHLVDDAPLVLMLYDTMDTLVISARDRKSVDYRERIADQNLTWKMRMLTGAGLLLVAVLLILFAIDYTVAFFSMLLPSLVCGFGILLLAAGYRLHARREHARKDLVLGTLIILIGLLMFPLWPLFVVLLLVVFTLWFSASAWVSLRRAIREKSAVPQGIWLTMGMGAGSLALAILAFLYPWELLKVLISLLAIVTFLGAVLALLDGYGMRNAASLMEEARAQAP